MSLLLLSGLDGWKPNPLYTEYSNESILFNLNEFLEFLVLIVRSRLKDSSFSLLFFDRADLILWLSAELILFEIGC